MRPALLLLALLSLAACGAPRDESQQAKCDREAWNDPKVKDLMVRSQASAWLYQANLPTIRTLHDQAKFKCLAEHGLAVPGGVQPVMPYTH
jgi:hypothetical protein